MKMLILLLALLSFAATNLRAATNFVILGDDFQAKINASAPGDTLVVQAGVYPGNLNFNKPLTVLRSGTNQIQLLGTVQITGTGSSSFQFSQFFSAVTIQATGTVSFAQSQFVAPVTAQAANILLSHVTSAHSFTADLSTTIGTNLQAFDTAFNTFNSFGLSVTGGKTLIKRCVVDGLTLAGNASLEAMRMTNYYAANDGQQPATIATASVESGAKFVAVQSTFFSSVILSGYKVWLGYDSWPLGGIRMTNCDAALVGNKIYPTSLAAQSVIYSQGGSLKAYNNLIGVVSSGALYGIWARSNITEIVNNTILANGGAGADPRLIFLTEEVFPATVRSDIVYLFNNGGGYGYCFYADGQLANVSYCDLFLAGGPGQAFYPAPVVNSIFTDPIMTAFNSSAQLHPSSPCIDAGPPDAIYNDRDGSRNDIGHTGGPYWNPANYTNDNPMVFFLTGSPQTVLKGVQTNILVNVGASAGH